MKSIIYVSILCILGVLVGCNENYIQAKREGLLPTKDVNFRSLGFLKEDVLEKQAQEERRLSP